MRPLRSLLSVVVVMAACSSPAGRNGPGSEGGTGGEEEGGSGGQVGVGRAVAEPELDPGGASALARHASEREPVVVGVGVGLTP